MRNGILLLSFALALSPAICSAQSTVNFGAYPGERDVHSISDNALPDGNSVWVGFFDSGFDVAAASGDLSALEAGWNLLTKDTIRNIWGEAGRFGDFASTSDPTFDNSQIWFWIFQTSDNTTPDVGFGDVIGYGLFSGTDPNWYLPPQGVAYPDDTTDVSSDDVSVAYYGSFDKNHLILQSIPEPSTVGILILGIGCLSLHIWRKKPTNPFQE